MFLDLMEPVIKASNKQEFLDILQEHTGSFGFQFFAAVVLIDDPIKHVRTVSFDNTPAEYMETYQDRDTAIGDPVMQHCKRSSLPIVWDRSTYEAAGAGDSWEFQSQFGYKTGVNIAMHLPEGKHFLLGVDGPDSVPRNPAFIQRLVADLQLLTVCASETAFRLSSADCQTVGRDETRLSAREREALHWAACGKTCWEIGRLLSISDNTVAKHLNSARRKLDCVSTSQAVARAVAGGLLNL